MIVPLFRSTKKHNIQMHPRDKCSFFLPIDGGALVRLVRLVGGFKMPLPSTCPTEFAPMPEHFVEDAVELVIFASRIPKPLDGVLLVGLMILSSDWWAFDTHSIRSSDVVIMSSSKVRASSAEEEVDISAQSFLLDDKNGGNVFKSLAGLAISQDGRHWARIEGEHHM
ncbi:hypothetical protein ACE6H2_012558 [Prunus campanulata]